MKMKYVIVTGAALFLSIMGFGMYFIAKADRAAMQHEHDRQQKILSHIGETVIVGNDTLIITDVNFWKNNFILNNGKEVSMWFVIK